MLAERERRRSVSLLLELALLASGSVAEEAGC